MFRVEVIADNSGKWCYNSLTFPSREEAAKYGQGLASRWSGVRQWKVVEIEHEPQQITAG